MNQTLKMYTEFQTMKKISWIVLTDFSKPFISIQDIMFLCVIYSDFDRSSLFMSSENHNFRKPDFR